MTKPTPKDRALADALDTVAREAEPEVRAAILAALERTRDELTLEAITNALRSADPEAGLGALIVESLVSRIETATNELIGVYTAGGVAMAEALAVGYTGSPIEVRFDTLNPRVIEHVRQYRLNLVTSLTDEARDGVRAILDRGFRQGLHPTIGEPGRRSMASELRDVVGLNERQSQALANFRQGLERRELDRALGRDLGQRLAAQTRRLIQQGELIDTGRIDALVDDYRDRLIRRRADTIARTESIRALSEGQHAAIREAVAQGHLQGETLRRYWLLTRDEKTCPICSGIVASNRNGVGAEEPFVTSLGPILNPPAHPNCRCSIFYRTQTTNPWLAELNPAPRVVTDRTGRPRYETLAEAYARPVRGPLRRRR